MVLTPPQKMLNLGRVYYCFSNIIQDYYPQWEDVLTNQYNGTGYGFFYGSGGVVFMGRTMVEPW